MSMRLAMRLCVLAVLAGASPATGQDAPANAIPDPASITIPDLSGGRDPDVVSNGWKYFYFWRADTSFDQAYADFADCYRFMPVAGGDARLPAFVPWEEATGVGEVPTAISPYGVVGEVIGAIVAGPLIRRAHQSRLRRCMEPRGYQRFPLQERRWEELTDNFSRASIAMQARAASGPRPDADPLPETR